MSKIPKPATQREMIEQLWYAVLGSNGDGIAAVTRRNSEDIGEIRQVLPTLQTKAEWVAGCVDTVRETRSTKFRKTDIAIAVMMLVVTTVSVIGAFI